MDRHRAMGNKKLIPVPNPSADLAEFLGVGLGDGNIRSNFQVAISFNLKTEQGYANYITRLIHTLFGLFPKERLRPKYGAGELVINSSSLVEFLCSEGMVKGDKIKNDAALPRWVFDCQSTQKSSVRGLTVIWLMGLFIGTPNWSLQPIRP